MATKYFPSESGSSNCRGILTYTTSQTATQVTINTSAVLQVNGVYGSGYECILKVNNVTQKDVTDHKDPPATTGWSTFLETGNVSKNYNRTSENQTVTISVSFAGKSHDGWSAGLGSGSTSVTITIPKLDTPTVTQTFDSKTGTSVRMLWSSNITCDYVWYSTNGGTSWTAVGSVSATSGAYTITGLSTNTTYSIKTRLRGSASQLTADSSALSVTTYAAPTSNQSFNSKTDTTIKIDWSSNQTCDTLFYSVNGTWSAAQTINASSGTYTISGLTADTTYSIITRLRGKDSKVFTNSSALSVTTYGYPSVTQSVSSKTATSITMAWSSGSTCDYVWYSKNGGSSWTAVGSVNASSGSYTISGLANETTYQIVTRLRRKDSQLTKDSSVQSVTTYGYPTVTQSLNSKTETTITMNWSSASTIDYLWYSTNGGTNWTGVDVADGKSGTYTISGLSANTSYSIKTRLRRKDSQLTKDSGALSVTTYDYPHATNMPNFTIGNSLKVTIYNPLSRSVSVTFIAADNSTKSFGTITGTTAEGFNAAAWKTFLYASIPSAKNGTYQIKITYSGVNRTNAGGTYTINTTECKPTIGSLTYQDTNSTTTTVTTDNQKIVQNLSTVRYTASTLSVKNSATISSVTLAVNGSTYNLTVSGSSATGGNASINSGSNVTATATITDSRGLTGTKTVTVSMLAWSLPSAIITLARQSNYYATTYLKCDAIYSSVNSKNTITISYTGTAVPRSGMTTPSSVSGTLSDNVQITLTLDNEFDWNFTITLVDKFGTTTYNRVLARGTPIMFWDDRMNSVGVNRLPSHSNAFESDLMYLEGNNMKFTTHQYLASSAQLSSAGWYRIATWAIGANSNARGSAGICVDITIATQYQASNNCIHKISLMGIYDRIGFVDETSSANTNGITKIRYTRSTSNNGAIDVYYNLSAANNVRLDIASYFAYSFRIADFTSVDLEPSDEDVVAEYTFKSNYNEHDDRYYASGDSETFSTYMAVGGIYNSAKRFYFTITTPKRLDNITTVTVSTLKARVSGVGGLIESSSSTYDWTSGYTITVTNTGKDYVTVRVDKSTVLSGATVDTPVIVYLGTLTLSFS